MRFLYISNIAGKHMAYNFCGSAIEAAKELNMEVFSAANRAAATAEDIRADEEKYGIHLLHVDLCRSPFAFRQNRKAYRQLVNIIKENNIDVIHCNTPVGGLLGRLAGSKCKVKQVIYEAHGFHFFKGAPLRNRLLYYPVEKWLAHKTDAIITMNEEDYQAAQKFRLKKGGKVYKVHGVGIDLSGYTGEADPALRASLGIAEDDVMLISAGDLVERKNYSVALRAIAATGLKKLKYCICGTGPMMEKLRQEAADLGIEEQVLFLGFRTDVKALLKVSDIFLFTTKQEGLPRSMMEAMASGLPCVVSRIRGNVDLIEEGKGGFLCDPANPDDFAAAIRKLYDNAELCREMRRYNLERIQDYDVSVVEKEIFGIYSEVLGGMRTEDASVQADPVS